MFRRFMLSYLLKIYKSLDGNLVVLLSLLKESRRLLRAGAYRRDELPPGAFIMKKPVFSNNERMIRYRV